MEEKISLSQMSTNLAVELRLRKEEIKIRIVGYILSKDILIQKTCGKRFGT